ncbi:uncharacterized protein [Gossypium hirsutum]|uniref:CCHC-type domain-containing protein n=1 Tax=Gossypium hirsutum TaxID=3635 RepID=A0A1U8P796_GOSHI|nr:uncharacterized protein LOC107955806 [Gossypium hirsutum]
MRPKKKAKSDGPMRVGPSVAPTGVAPCGHYSRRHLGDCCRTIGACLRCGSTEHRVRDCPLRIDQVQALGSGTVQPLKVVQQPSRGRGQARGVNALIDIGSAHSYVASTVSETLGIPIEGTDSKVTMLSPLGQSIRVSKLYKDVPLEVQRTVFLADLMELLFGEFDLILRMDWLVKHRISLDCTTKRVILWTEEDSEVMVIGDRRDYLTNVISALVAEKLVRRGYVFPEELPGLPPSRGVDFRIELFPGTSQVSITPYQMASKELTELKAQIQELLDRGFIRSSVSSWRAPVLFMKRKMGQ